VDVGIDIFQVCPRELRGRYLVGASRFSSSSQCCTTTIDAAPLDCSGSTAMNRPSGTASMKRRFASASSCMKPPSNTTRGVSERNADDWEATRADSIFPWFSK
jgi:hypothetical protein